MNGQPYPVSITSIAQGQLKWRRCSALGVEVFILALLVATAAWARRPVTRLSGHWTITIGPAEVLRGTWTAQISARKPNRAQGYWRLLSENGEILSEGKWWVRKNSHGWHGTWKVRNGDSQPINGVWHANISSSTTSTFAEVLKSTASKILTGNWQRPGYAGNWWVRGPSRREQQP